MLRSPAVARVLIVEDDAHVGPDLAAELEIRGHVVRWVRDAEAGAPDPAAAPPDAVVLDYFLPRGDGIELARAWKGCRPPPAVILVSGADVLSEVQRRLPADRRPDRLFAKPIGLTAVVQELERLLGGPAPAASAPAAPPPRADAPLDAAATLPELLWHLAQSRRSGTLDLEEGDTARVVHILNGDPVFVESGTLDETLGRLLLRQGAVTADQYERVLRRMTDDLIAGEDVRFGEIVVEMGFAAAEHVVETMRTQVREKLVNLFHSPRPRARFRDGADELAVGTAFRVDAGEIILEGVRRHYGLDRLEPALGPRLDRYAALSPSFEEHRRRFRFGPREERFLQQLRGARTLRALVEGGGLDRVHAMQLLFALSCVDALELAADPIARERRAPPPSARGREHRPAEPAAREEVLARHLRTSGRSHYEVLGIAADATLETIERAYAALARRFAPERLVELSLGDAHERATEVWAQITMAHDVLRDAARRARYDETLRRGQTVHVPGAAPSPEERRRRGGEFAAEAAFRRGLRELGAGNLVKAMLEFAAAKAQAPREPEYAAYELWTACLRAVEDGADLAATAREARARIEALLVDRSPRPRVLFLLALASQLLGEADAARQHARAALSFDPSYAEARRLLESLTEPGPPPTTMLG